MERESIFAICRKSDSPGSFYSTHGPVCGVEDAIGYGSLEDARKFLSFEEAQTYIDRELPGWSKELHRPVEVYSWELTFAAPELAVLLRHGEPEIPLCLLEPAQGRLLIWRR